MNESQARQIGLSIGSTLLLMIGAIPSSGAPQEATTVKVERVKPKQKKYPTLQFLRSNIDFTIGAMSYIAGMGERAGETIFGVSRSVGWIAHALEEYQEPALRFRPRAHYTGPAPGR